VTVASGAESRSAFGPVNVMFSACSRSDRATLHVPSDLFFFPSITYSHNAINQAHFCRKMSMWRQKKIVSEVARSRAPKAGLELKVRR